ncbi:MAG: hypothetical protein IM665_08560 [Phenylobacterium sp.]|nr:hypothetical protein [Phenylobacterium sp.]
MTDWIEHNGGPQPVGDDVWVEVQWATLEGGYPSRDPDEFDAASEIPWGGHKKRYRILNQHLIDAALKRGIELGLEAAEQAALKAENTLENEWRAGDKSDSHLEGRSDGMGEAADIIRNLNPETIAKEAHHE